MTDGIAVRENSVILVLGATGGQGGAVTAALLRRGVTVRAMAREPGSPRAVALAGAGVEVVAGSFTDARSLRSAMRAVSAVFALTTRFEQGPEAEVAQGMALLAAAAHSDVPFLVYSSVAGALAHSGVPHFESKAQIERELARMGLPHAVLAPTYFYDNLAPQIIDLAAGVISLPLPTQQRLQQLDRRAFGQLAATVLLAPQDWSGQRLEVAADAPTGDEMAEALGLAAGRRVRFRRVPLAQVLAVNPDMGAMWRFLNTTGYQVDIAALKTRFPDVEWTSFAQWAREMLDSPDAAPVGGRGGPR